MSSYSFNGSFWVGDGNDDIGEAVPVYNGAWEKRRREGDSAGLGASNTEGIARTKRYTSWW